MYKAAVRRRRIALLRRRAAEASEQRRKQELAEKQQAFRDARAARAREKAISFDAPAAEKTAEEAARRAKRDRIVAAHPARVKGRGVGAAVGAVLGDRRARVGGGLLHIDGSPPVPLNGAPHLARTNSEGAHPHTAPHTSPPPRPPLLPHRHAAPRGTRRPHWRVLNHGWCVGARAARGRR